MIVIKNKVVVFLLFFSMLFSSFISQASLSFADNKKPEILVVYHPKIELLNIISLTNQINDYFACDRLNTVIKRDVVAWFRPFQEKKAIKVYQQLISSGQSDATLRKFLMELGDLPELEIPETLPLEFKDPIFTTFRDDLVSFCTDSDFFTFFRREREYYDMIIDQFTLECNVREMVEKEFAFVGVQDFACHFVLSPLSMESQVLYTETDSKKTGMVILGLSDVENGRLLFGTNQTQIDLIKNDFLTLLVASITKPFEKEIDKQNKLMTPIKEKMDAYQINSWQDCFNHHLSLSIGILCFEDQPEEKLTDLRKLGFVYINDIYDLLKQYNNYRDYFPTLSSFLPRIISQFDAIERRNP